MNWIRLALIAAALAALAAGGAAVRSHLIDVGEQRMQTRWDAQIAVDQAKTLELERERNAEQLLKFRNAERISDEQTKREAAGKLRIAAGDAVADRLRGTIERLNRRDVSAAAGDPGSVALAEGAATARQLFGSCTERYRGLAEKADRLRDQVSGLQDDAVHVCRPIQQPSAPQPQAADK